MNIKQNQQGILFIIMAGMFFALMTFFVRLSGNLPTMQKAFFRNAVAAVVAIIMLSRSKQGFTIQKMSWLSLFLCLLLAGIFATGGQLSITAAYTKAPAREISVFDYSQVIFAALLGFLFLGQIPDRMSMIGYVLIIGSAVCKWAYTIRNVESRSEP